MFFWEYTVFIEATQCSFNNPPTAKTCGIMDGVFHCSLRLKALYTMHRYTRKRQIVQKVTFWSSYENWSLIKYRYQFHDTFGSRYSFLRFIPTNRCVLNIFGYFFLPYSKHGVSFSLVVFVLITLTCHLHDSVRNFLNLADKTLNLLYTKLLQMCSRMHEK